jgi:FHS family L-fucose permease-like MFS transporter
MISISTTSGFTGQKSASNVPAAIVMLFVLFFTCGFLAALNDILIPHLKPIFDLSYAEVMLIQFSFFSAFLLFAVPSGKLIESIGHQYVMVLGLTAMGAGALLFIQQRACLRSRFFCVRFSCWQAE